MPADDRLPEGSPERLLAVARRMSAGRSTLPPRRVTRSAALLARTALELWVDRELAAQKLNLDRARMRSKLICLRELASRDSGRQAAMAWAGLSNACHQHAYELSPTAGEVDHLLAAVAELIGTDCAPRER